MMQNIIIKNNEYVIILYIDRGTTYLILTFTNVNA